MSKENEDILQKTHEAIGELRKEIDSKVTPNLEKVDNLQKALDVLEEANQKNLKAREEAEKKSEEMEERFKALELDLARAAQPVGKNYKETEEYKAFDAFIRTHSKQLDDVLEKAGLDYKTLRSDSDAAGGYLAPVELDNMMLKKVTEISDIRSISRVRTVSAKQLSMARRGSIPTAQYEGELETGTDSESTYEQELVTPYRLTFTTPISLDLLMDSSWNMESEIMGDAAEAFAKGEGSNFVSGSGFKGPEGFLTNAEIVANVRTSTPSGGVDADDVILLTGDLKNGYNPVYVMNRRTLAILRTKKSTDGVFLWQPGLNGPVANTLNGFPYLLADDMPDIASNSLSIAFGDFRKGYVITDRTGLAVIRDEYTLKKQAAVEFTFNRWNTGQVVLAEAIKVLKTKA